MIKVYLASNSSSNSHVFVMSYHNLMRSFDVNCWPTTCGGKKVRLLSVFKITQQHTNNWEAGRLLFQCTVFSIVDVPPFEYEQIYKFFLMTNDMMSLLVISLDVHVSILLKCW